MPNAKKRVAANLIPSMVKKLNKKEGVEQMIPRVCGYNLRGSILRKCFVCAPKCSSLGLKMDRKRMKKNNVFSFYMV